MIKIIATRIRRAVERVAARAGRLHGRMKAWWTTKRRAYLYRVLGSLGPVAIAYGEIAGERAGTYAGFAATTIGVLVAAANTSTE